MAEPEGITLKMEMNTDKLQMKLRAIAKHAEALANELDAIDNAWKCPNCGASDYQDVFANDEFEFRHCNECNHAFTGDKVELPTQLEGSE